MANKYLTSVASIPTDIDTQDGYISSWIAFDKGRTPPPLKIESIPSLGVVKVVFEQTELGQCICEIECQTRGTVVGIGPFCIEDEDYTAVFTEQTFLDEDATLLSFLFIDPLGNESTLEIRSLAKTIPAPPLAAVNQGDILVGIPLTGYTGADLSDAITHYQIERYVRNTSNSTLWVDWTPVGRNPNTHTDRRPPSGVTHGYRVRYRTTFDNSSKWSGWGTISAGSAGPSFFYPGGYVQEFYVGESISILPENVEGYTYFEEVD